MEPIYRLCEACLGTGIKTSTYKKVQKVEDCEFCDGTGKFPTAYFVMNGDPRKLSIQLNDLPELEQRMILQGSHGIRVGDIVNGALIGTIEGHTENKIILEKDRFIACKTATEDSDINK